MPRAKLSDIQPGGAQTGRASLNDISAPHTQTAPEDDRNDLQKAFDELATPPNFDIHHPFSSGAQDFGAGVIGLMAPIFHPERTAKTAVGLLGAGFGAPNQFTQEAEEGMVSPFLRREGEKGGDYAARLEGGAIAALPGLAAPEIVRDVPFAGASIRDAALGDPDAAALRALRVSGKSPRAIRTLESVEGARPFLKGVKTVEEAQTRIPAAKAEIWSPYKEAIDKYGARPVQGPDGMTTIGDLEAERTQLSALNRGLKTGDPQALELAKQKGMSAAQLLARERSVQQALDPALENIGIKPQEIRKAFGQVSQVGSQILGRSTVGEEAPFGLGRVRNFTLNPFRDIRQTFAAGRDIAAGRPWWKGSPSDINLREAFRTGGEKPNFGAVRPLPRWQLPAEATIREGEEEVGPWQFGVLHGPTVTPPPRSFLRLPATAGEGEAEPMLRYAKPYVEPAEPSTIRPMPPRNLLRLPAQASEGVARLIDRITGTKNTEPLHPFREKTRIARPRFAIPEAARTGMRAPEGMTRAPRGLLPGRQEEALPPEPHPGRIHPGGSAFRGATEDVEYPPASIFRRKRPAFDLLKYLKEHQ